MKKSYYCLFIHILILITALCGCGKRQNYEGENEYLIYCLDRDENTHKTYSWYTDITDSSELTDKLLEQMSLPPDDIGLVETIRNFSVQSYNIENGQLTIDVSENYKNLIPTTEILVRGALVRTLAQIDGVEKVKIDVHGEELVDSLGFAVGAMSASQFVDNAGNEINSYEAIRIALYFSNADGTGLAKVNRTLEYNTNISTEKLVIEQLIEGPVTTGMRACINPQTEVINVTIKDGTGYVSFDDTFLTLPDGITPEMAVYSVVNSLSELPGVNRVQISIDGESNVALRDDFNLDTMFERNLEIVE